LSTLVLKYLASLIMCGRPHIIWYWQWQTRGDAPNL